MAGDKPVQGGDPLKSVKLLGEKQPEGWAKQLADIAVDLPAHNANRPVLLQCASYLADAGEVSQSVACERTLRTYGL